MGTIRSLNEHYQHRLKEMKEINQRSIEARRRQITIVEDVEFCKSTLKFVTNLNEALQGKNLAFIDDIVKMLEESVEYAVNSVLPLKRYKVEIDYKPYRNNGTMKLYFIKEDGTRIPPKIIEGDMLNQVLSFSSLTHITYLMGYRKVFYDEAFASANVRSLALINAVILYYNSLGVQFVFVTQSPILYAGLERTMIELVSDGKQVVDVNTTTVKPDEKEFETIAKVIELFDSITKIKE